MIGPHGKRELDPGLAEQRHRVLEAALHLVKIKATESKLETEAQRGKKTTRVVEVKDVAQDHLRSNKIPVRYRLSEAISVLTREQNYRA